MTSIRVFLLRNSWDKFLVVLKSLRTSFKKVTEPVEFGYVDFRPWIVVVACWEERVARYAVALWEYRMVASSCSTPLVGPVTINTCGMSSWHEIVVHSVHTHTLPCWSGRCFSECWFSHLYSTRTVFLDAARFVQRSKRRLTLRLKDGLKIQMIDQTRRIQQYLSSHIYLQY
jgi:hypothetical protein